MSQSILLLDLSVRCTGYAVIQWPANFRPDGTWAEPLAQQAITVPPFGEFKVERADLSVQERIGIVTLLVNGLVDLYQPLCVAAEMPRHMFQGNAGRSVSNNQSTLMQQRVFGAVSAALWMRGMPFIEVDPKWSKGALTGKSGAKKTDVKLALAKRLGLTADHGRQPRFPKGWTESVRDALAVAFYLQHQYTIYGADWLDTTLGLQAKPTLSWWHDWRQETYAVLMGELQHRHRKEVGGSREGVS